MRYLFCVIIYTSLSLTLFAGNEGSPVGGRRLGMGGAFSAIRGDMWSLWANPAGLTGIQRFEGGLFTESRFMIQEMSSAAFGGVIPFQQKHYAGISASTFGFGTYRENLASATYATTLYERIHFGVKFNLLNLAITNYGSVMAFYANAGMMADVSKKVTIGLWTQNINQASIGSFQEEKIPIIVNGGIAYKPSDKILITADAVKYIDYPLGVRGGFEYFFIPKFCVRAGYSTQPVSSHFGAGFRLDNINIDFANTLHDRLGYSPHLSITLRLGKNKSESSEPSSENPPVPKSQNDKTIVKSDKTVKPAVSVTATKKDIKALSKPGNNNTEPKNDTPSAKPQ